ncbi:ABC transporter ATP-binding protein [Pusillimonas sp.]|uniref:ABC transporter ATP-binding protein n=1 Tax=Pusillimonas sp. TaxID=3040095 RepID=UPI0037C8292E
MPIIKSVSFDAQQGDFISIVGPSGCGKTTLLMCLTGLLNVDGGELRFADQKVTEPPPGVSVVFQDYSRSLLPWKSCFDNVLFGMRRITDMSMREKQDWARELIKSVGLEGFESNYPWQMSGGMQQRVAIARGLAARSRLLLLDEPLAAVDAQTRAEMQDLLLELAQKYKQTCILVTHDVDEAVYMATRIIVLSKRPTTVVEDFDVVLPPVRDQLTTREHPDFLALRHKVITLIRNTGAPAPGPEPLH